MLWQEHSLAYRAAGDGILIDAVNYVVLALVALGWIDLIFHDMLGKLLLPSVSNHVRHHVCVTLYSVLAMAFGVRAFIAAGDPTLVWVVGGYYLLLAPGILIQAAAIACEDRHGA
jgi:hypothetical protein